MATTNGHSTAWLVGRALLPSFASLSIAILGGAALLIGHLVSISLSWGTILPDFWDGDFSIFYTNTVVRPLLALLSVNHLSTAIVIFLWGVFGLVVYTAVELLIHGVQSFKEANNGVQYVDRRTVIRHPVMKIFWQVAMWRLMVGMLIVWGVTLLVPLANHAWQQDFRLAEGLPIAEAARIVSLSLLTWVLCAHFATVSLRLYTLRTRLLGETLY